MKQLKKSILLLSVLIIAMFAGCVSIENTELAEPTPEPTPSPVIDTSIYYEETDISVITAPSSVDELSDIIGIVIAAPSEPIAGMTLDSIGYDGYGTGALKYKSENGNTLLYTIYNGIDALPDDFYSETTVSGFRVNLCFYDGGYVGAYWIKGGCTYCAYAEPCVSEESIRGAVQAMILAHKACDDSENVLTLSTLEHLVGYEVKEPKGLPEDYSFAKMYALNGETAVTVYESKSIILTFEQCEGSVYPDRIATYELPSGSEMTVGNISVKTYRSDNGCCLSEWIDGGFGYSITVTNKKEDFSDIKDVKMEELIKCFMGI